MKKFIFTCFMLLSSHVFAQSNNDRSVRDSFTLSMPDEKGAVYESRVPSSPFVVGLMALQLFPGETVFLEIEETNGLITNIKTVKENKSPDHTLEISFIQNLEGKAHSNIMLKVKNPFKRDLLYDATIQFLKSGRWAKTSIIPVKAGLMGIEMWPDLIMSIGASEWKLL